MAKTEWTLVQFPNLDPSVDRSVADAIQLLFKGLKDHSDAFTSLKSQLTTVQSTTSTSASTGITGVASGGTGTQTLSTFGVLIGQGANPVQTAAPGPAGYILKSSGTGSNPTFKAPTHSESLTDGASNFIFAGGDVVTVTGVLD